MKTVKLVSLFLAMLLLCNAYADGTTFTLTSKDGQPITVPKNLAEYSEFLKNGLEYGDVFEFDKLFSHDELIVLVELLNVLDREVKRVAKEGGATDIRVIYNTIIPLRGRSHINIDRFFRIIDYFLVTKFLDDVILAHGQLPLLPGEEEKGTPEYDKVVAAFFSYIVKHIPSNSQHWALLGRMLYPMIHEKTGLKYMFDSLNGHPKTEEIVLNAYMQQHPELYKVRKIDLRSNKVSFEFFKQGIFVADGSDLKFYDIDRLNVQRGFCYRNRPDYCVLSPDGKTLAVDETNEIRLLDSNNGDELYRLPCALVMSSPQLMFSPKGNRLAAVAVKPGSVERLSSYQLFCLDTRNLLKTYGEYQQVLGVTFSPDSTKFAFAAVKDFKDISLVDDDYHTNITICFGDAVSGEKIGEFNYKGETRVLALGLNPAIGPIVVDRYGIVGLNSEKKAERILFEPKLQCHAVVSAAAFSPDYNTIAIMYNWSRQCIMFYSVKTGRLLSEFPPLGTFAEFKPINNVRFSLDGLYCAFVNGRPGDDTWAPHHLRPASVCVFRPIISLIDALKIPLESDQSSPSSSSSHPKQ